MITLLATILLPVQARDKFLEQVRINTCFINYTILLFYKILRFTKTKEMLVNLYG